MNSINGKFDCATPASALKQSMDMIEKINSIKEDKFRYIWKTCGRFDGIVFEMTESPFTILLPYLDSGNNLLDDLFVKYPDFSEKQWFYWHKIIDEIYYYTETPEGRKQMQDTKDAFYWLEMMTTKCSLSLYDDSFVRKFYSSIKEKAHLNRPLSQKQLDLVEKFRKRYWRQLSLKTLERI